MRRREFFVAGSTAMAAEVLLAQRRLVAAAQSPNQRPRIGAIGVGGRGLGIAQAAARFGDIVAIADVDPDRAELANSDPQRGVGKGSATLYSDYRKLLERSDLDFVTIGTPDHWHTRICIDALKAGKDVYCEKPLTLTIQEGEQILKVLRETKRVMQVGTQQRSEMQNLFLQAAGIVRDGRIGKVTRVTCAIGGAPRGGPFSGSTPPLGLDWNLWLGQAPLVEFIPERCHYTFRWWYEYSGGKLTDWGAHHIDIAHWALDDPAVVSLDPVEVQHPQPLQAGRPTDPRSFNTATSFRVRCRLSNGVELVIRDSASDLGFDNGILFEGEAGKFFVSRSKSTGAPVDALKEKPLSPDLLRKLRKGKPLSGHMENFLLCVQDRSEPVSDVASHHRAMTTCHLANIALRLGRPIRWDAEQGRVISDPEADSWRAREQRRGFETG